MRRRRPTRSCAHTPTGEEAGAQRSRQHGPRRRREDRRMNPIGSIASLSGDLLIGVIAGLVFIEETGIPVPFAPGDLLLIIAGIAIASDTVEPVQIFCALLVDTVIGAMIGREVFAAVGRPALVKAADALGFRPGLERATRLLR